VRAADTGRVPRTPKPVISGRARLHAYGPRFACSSRTRTARGLVNRTRALVVVQGRDTTTKLNRSTVSPECPSSKPIRTRIKNRQPGPGDRRYTSRYAFPCSRRNLSKNITGGETRTAFFALANSERFPGRCLSNSVGSLRFVGTVIRNARLYERSPTRSFGRRAGMVVFDDGIKGLRYSSAINGRLHALHWAFTCPTESIKGFRQFIGRRTSGRSSPIASFGIGHQRPKNLPFEPPPRVIHTPSNSTSVVRNSRAVVGTGFRSSPATEYIDSPRYAQHDAGGTNVPANRRRSHTRDATGRRRTDRNEIGRSH